MCGSSFFYCDIWYTDSGSQNQHINNSQLNGVFVYTGVFSSIVKAKVEYDSNDKNIGVIIIIIMGVKSEFR